ncbi:hypothetical protein LQZ18_16955 [Lachnospiraceae bacterium ZAX-1]
MSMNSISKKIGALICAAMLVLSTSLPVHALETYDKEEVVYVKLGYDGAVDAVYVVNSFEADAKSVVSDSGNYLSVLNLTTTDPITLENGNVSFTAPGGKFYYKGVLNTLEIPWDISVSYLLDGEAIRADMLAGRNGQLQIYISLKQKESANAAYREHYAIQASLSLDSALCKNILAPDATVANVGDQKQLSYIVLPNKNKEITITADVADFKMNGISINMVPLSLGIDRPDISELKDRLSKLQDGAVELDDGSIQLKDGTTELEDGVFKFRDGVAELYDGTIKLRDRAVELNGGVSILKDGTEKLNSSTIKLWDGITAIKNKMPKLKDGTAELKNGAQKLVVGSADMKSGAVSLEAGADSLVAGAADFYAGIESVNNKSDELTAGSAAIKKGLQELALGVGGMDAESMRTATDQAATLQGGSQAFQDGLDAWLAAYGSTINPEALAAFRMLAANYAQINDGVVKIINEVSSQSTAMPKLVGGITTLSSQYETLDGGISAYTDGVQQLYVRFGEMQSGINALSGGLRELKNATTKLHSGSQELYNGTAELHSGVTMLDDGISKLQGGSMAFQDGVSKLQDGATSLYDGTLKLGDGTSKLYDGVSTTQDKMVDLIDGTSTLKDGTLDLADATGELREKTATMDHDVEEEIDTMLDEYRNTDFTPVSFTNATNSHVRSVQFVMKTADINMDSGDNEPVKEEIVPLTIWQRFLSLFKK